MPRAGTYREDSFCRRQRHSHNQGHRRDGHEVLCREGSPPPPLDPRLSFDVLPYLRSHFCVQGCLAIRRVAKEDMRRLAKCTGGNIILSLANMEGDETFDPKDLGHADAIREVRVGDSEMTIFEGTKNYRSGSILLRGANSYMSVTRRRFHVTSSHVLCRLDEMERSLHDR